MENNFSLKMYLEGYENVVKKANDLVAVDLDGRKKELESQIKEAESKVNSMTGMTSKQFQQKSKPYMELIKNNEKEINRINDEKPKRAKNPERQQEAEELEEAKKRIIESAKEAASKAESAISDKINSIEKPLNDVKREKAELEKQLKDLEDQENADPQRAKDVKYKEFLKEKIKPLDEKIKDMEPGIKKELKSLNSKESLNAIKEELRRFLLNTGKIDRNETLIPMADDIAKQNKEEKQRKEERSERKYNKAWIEAIKENCARDEQKAAKIEQESAKPEQEPVKVEQEKDENAEDILGVYDSSDVTGELPDDIEITLGRKGSIVYDGEKYRIPRKALRNVDELDWNDMVESIKETGMFVENEELLKAALKTKSIDYAVINGICNAKKMENGDKAVILNNYFNDCFKSSKFKDVENVCNINYDLKDLSKTSLMTGLSKYAFLQRAERAERFNVGHRIGEFKPTLLSKLIGRIRGENLEKLAEKNENRAYENATIVNEALGKEKEEAKSFLRGLRVEEPIDLGKDKGKAELDLDQLHEIKRVYVEENKKRDDEGR